MPSDPKMKTAGGGKGFESRGRKGIRVTGGTDTLGAREGEEKMTLFEETHPTTRTLPLEFYVFAPADFVCSVLFLYRVDDAMGFETAEESIPGVPAVRAGGAVGGFVGAVGGWVGGDV